MDGFESREFSMGTMDPRRQWSYGTFLCGPELMMDVWNAQDHAYSIDQFNQYRESDKRANRLYQRAEHIDWKKFHAQPTPTVVVAQHLYSKSGKQKLFMDRLIEQAPPPPPVLLLVDEVKVMLNECFKLFKKMLTKAGYQVSMWYVDESECGAALRSPYVAVRTIHHSAPEVWKFYTTSFIVLGMSYISVAYAIQDHKLGQKEFTRKSPTLAPHLASVSNFAGTLQGALVFNSLAPIPCDRSIRIKTPRGIRKVMPEEW
jgi:hypothetical protein